MGPQLNRAHQGGLELACAGRWLMCLSVLLCALAACRPLPGDVRCRSAPPAGKSYGFCDASWRAYFDEQTFKCNPAGGCLDQCDAACQQTEVPFESVEECNRICLPEMK